MNTSIFNWTTISACVKAHFRAYNVRIVETEPNAGTYIEAGVWRRSPDGCGTPQVAARALTCCTCNTFATRSLAESRGETR